MLTPLDIQKKEFRRSFRGYNNEEVDSFLDRIMQDYETLYRENQDLKERLAQSEQNMARYREIEDVLQKTMVLAQKNADELRQNAEKEAQLLLDRARIEAEQLSREAEQEAIAVIDKAEKQSTTMLAESEKEVMQTIEENSRLKKQQQVFKIHFRALLEAQVRFLDDVDVDVEETPPKEEEETEEFDDYMERDDNEEDVIVSM